MLPPPPVLIASLAPFITLPSAPPTPDATCPTPVAIFCKLGNLDFAARAFGAAGVAVPQFASAYESRKRHGGERGIGT